MINESKRKELDSHWEEIGLQRIRCKECYYNTGKCEDCLFFNGSECTEDSVEVKTEEK